MVRANKRPEHYKNIIKTLSNKLVKECQKLIKLNLELDEFYKNTKKPFDTKLKKDETRINNKRNDCIKLIEALNKDQDSVINSLLKDSKTMFGK